MMLRGVHAILQTAVVVPDRTAGVARMADLFGAVPTDRGFGPESARTHGTVYAFDNHSFFELLDPVEPGHTRHRFLERNGPGAYMLSVSLADEDEQGVGEAFRQRGIRAVVEGPFGTNHRYRWHLHPKDAGGLLVLASIMNDRDDNREWAGARYRDDVPFNSRLIREIVGLAGRTMDPAGEAATFAAIGFPMLTIGDAALGWRGATGTVLELWPQDAWAGPAVATRRDYAVVVRAADRDRLLQRLTEWNFTFEEARAGNRVLTSVDPVLGVRFAIEA